MASRVKRNIVTASLEHFLPGGSRWTSVPVEVPVAGILYGTRGNDGIYVLPQAVMPGSPEEATEKNLVFICSAKLTRITPGEEIGIVVPLESEPKPKPKRKEPNAETDNE